MISRIMRTGVVIMRTMEVIPDCRNPVIQVLDRMGCGEVFEVVDMPKCECKWYFNENGEYVRYED